MSATPVNAFHTAVDIRVLRQLRRSSGFTLTVVLILALGIGASTAVFSILDSVVVRHRGSGPRDPTDPMECRPFQSRFEHLNSASALRLDQARFAHLPVSRPI